jgi:hypothetical protein
MSFPAGQLVLPELHVPALCDESYVLSVESTDDAIEVLDQGNSISLRVSGRLRISGADSGSHSRHVS